jgi:uroporphyrinogen-III decarboxylase
MDSKERVLRALAGGKPDRAPFNFWMDRRLMAEYAGRLGGEYFRITHYGADVIETFPLLDWPRGPHMERDGTAWQLAPMVEDWSEAADLELPDADDDLVYELIRHDLEAFPDKAVFLDVMTPWGIISRIRTFQLAMTDMVDHPEEFKALSRRIEQIYAGTVERACRLGITALYLMEDIAGTQGLLFSRPMIQEFCLDFVRSLVDVARSHGLPVLWHTDGKPMDAFDLLIDLGVVAVNPLQPHLNDLDEFRRRFGGRLALYGGLDNCFIVPNGTPAEVRAHVLGTFARAGADGGLILSTHDLPMGTPQENVETLVRTIVDECRY